jgi:hypothetical protein
VAFFVFGETAASFSRKKCSSVTKREAILGFFRRWIVQGMKSTIHEVHFPSHAKYIIFCGVREIVQMPENQRCETRSFVGKLLVLIEVFDQCTNVVKSISWFTLSHRSNAKKL